MMILRLLDLADVLPCHVAPECCLNLYDQCNLIGVSQSISRILVVRRILDVVVVHLTIATAT